MADQQKSIGFNTRAAKTYLDGEKVRRPLTVPITQGNIFQIESSEMLGKLFKEGADEVYTRFGNPTLTAACEKCASLESAEAALVFSSGMIIEMDVAFNSYLRRAGKKECLGDRKY